MPDIATAKPVASQLKPRCCLTLDLGLSDADQTTCA